MTSVNRPGEQSTTGYDFYTAYSLIDITDTKDNNPKGSQPSFQQAQNLNTLVQILALRTQLTLSIVQKRELQNLSNYHFGSDYTGLQNVWVYKFGSEASNVWAKEEDMTFFARADCDRVPVYTGLDETVETQPMFVTNSNNILNLYFEKSKIV